MADKSRRLLKTFGVAVTNFEAQAETLEAAAEKLSAGSDKDQIATLLKEVTELCRELNTRWLEATQHIFEIESQLLVRCADAARRFQEVDPSDEVESARMEVRE